MSTFLLAWNPNRSSWDDLPGDVAAFAAGKTLVRRWSCARVKRIAVGDKVFLIRLTKPPKGIFGYGTVVKGSYEDEHWEYPRKNAQYVEFQIDWLVNPESDKIIPRSRLDKRPYSKMHWDTQSSGIHIPDDIAAALQREWEDIAPLTRFTLPEEREISGNFIQAPPTLVPVNSYERNPYARAACISHYGASCSVCKIDFSKAYGDIGRGFIHVHHLKPVSTRRDSYVLDAVRDLRPVCPNCHAIIHLSSPPLSIDRVRQMIRSPKVQRRSRTKRRNLDAQ